MLKNLLAKHDLRLTNKEQRISRILLANYPAAGLSTVADLAANAGVSIPTVLRFINKLGFSGYAAFQKSLIDEIGETLNSPLSLFKDQRQQAKHSLYQAHMQMLALSLDQAQANYVERDFEGIVDLLADERSVIHFLGGRFSAVLAMRMAQHLAQLRAGIHLLEPNSPTLPDKLVDYDSRVTLVVFDFRRYQPETIRFARLAAQRRVRLILFTDRWRSPIASFADKTLVSPVESETLFDSWIPAIAQTEALVAAVAARNPDRARERLSAIEAMRQAYASSDQSDATSGQPNNEV